MRNEAGTSAELKLQCGFLTTKTFLSNLEPETCTTRRDLWERDAYLYFVSNNCRLFRLGKFSADLSFFHGGHQYKIIFVMTGLELASLPRAPINCSASQAFIKIEGTTI